MKNRIINLPVFSTGDIMPVNILKTFCTKRSKHQQIEILDTVEFGMCLIIDGCMQTAESDHELYDTNMLSLLGEDDKNILILGGGDGYVAMHAIKTLPHANVTVVDIDADVIELARQYLHPGNQAYQDINFIVSNALTYLKENNMKFDAIVCDLTDMPVETKEIYDFRSFYCKLLPEIHRNLHAGGWLSLQAGSAKVSGKCMPIIHILKEIVSRSFSDIKESSVYISSYGEKWSFLYATKI